MTEENEVDVETLWLCMNGTEESITYYNIPRVNYPLCLNVPSVSWAKDAKEIKLLAHSAPFAYSVELLAELRQEVAAHSRTLGKDWFQGFRWCFGVSDGWFINKVPIPSIRDQATCEYYSRWPNGYNAVSELWKRKWEEITNMLVTLYSSTMKIERKLTFRFSPEEIVSFLSGFTSLNAGDLVSLGSVMITNHGKNDSQDFSLRVEDFAWEVAIKSQEIR